MYWHTHTMIILDCQTVMTTLALAYAAAYTYICQLNSKADFKLGDVIPDKHKSGIESSSCATAVP